MALGALIDVIGAHLTGALPGPPALVGAVLPAGPGDLPAVTLAVTQAVSARPGMGRIPGPTLTGALRVDVEVDLADPVLRFASEVVTLLSPDRRVLQIPHGSVVRADGTSDQPFTGADLSVRIGATTFTPVAGAPAAGQVQLDPAAGTLRFPSPRAANGTVVLGYFIGAWEVQTERFQGELTVEVFAGSAAGVDTLSRAVEAALALARLPAVSGVRALDPTALGAIGATTVLGGGARSRRLAYRFDFEHIEPVIETSGGPIHRIAVSSSVGPENFVVEHDSP